MLNQMNIEALIDRLQRFALGSDDEAMSEDELVVALRMLNRVLPDLHHIDLRAAGGQPILVTVAGAVAGDECEHKIAID